MHSPVQAQTRRAVSAAVIGNVLEWYDFSVYAFVAVIIARKFFPQGDDVIALLATFLAFGLGFVARPLGGIILGRLGDTRGRKTALLITIALMAVGTVMVGVLPTYAAIGVAAPLLLVVARLMQGFSAGGEWGSSTAYIVEWAPPDQRGFYGSFQQMSVVAGLLLGSAVAALMNTVLTPEQMEALRKAKGEEFDRLFLTGMIQHHGGALTMVKDLFDTAGAGQDAELFNFATDVDSGQRAEIRIMQNMLERKP